MTYRSLSGLIVGEEVLVVNKLEQIKQEYKETGTLGLSMGLRLFLFLILLVFTMVLGIIVILLLTGTFTAGVDENKKLLQNELNHISQHISQYYGQLSVQTVDFSRNLATSIEKMLLEKEIDLSGLQNNPEILEEILTDQFDRALFSLEKSKSSGVFIILDATINNKLEKSETSRAGLFIKNMEPNILNSSSPTIVLLRGFPNIARNNSLPLHAQWDMEFDISKAPYFHLPMEYAHKESLPLSRLYSWTPAFTLPGTSEEIILCSAPLIDSQGNILGVCGFEVSAMLFKLSYMPDYSTYSRIFCVLAPVSKDTIFTSGAMFSGGYSFKKNTLSPILNIEERRNSFYSYEGGKNEAFLGFHVPLELYPKDSAFADQKWSLAIMVPEEDIKDTLVSSTLRLAFMFTLLMLLGILLSFFLSKRYIKPITSGLDIIKSNDLSETPKTGILEINELIEYLASQSEEIHKKTEQETPSAALNEFARNIKNLSPAERSVFDLYVQQYTAKEIAGILCLSMNTIKTHTKRIYTKLNVSSREELLLYISMLKEAGKDLK